MTNKEKLHRIAVKDDQDTMKKVRERIKNRPQIRRSRKIALLVLERLEELGWNQTKLAKEMGVSRQQVSKITSGKENLTLKTLEQLHAVLGIAIFADHIEQKSRIHVVKVSLASKQSVPASEPNEVNWVASENIDTPRFREAPIIYNQIPCEA